jgi:hypothetical protein
MNPTIRVQDFQSGEIWTLSWHPATGRWWRGEPESGTSRSWLPVEVATHFLTGLAAGSWA